MICWNCRQEADPGSDFCMNCGADLSKAPSAKEPAKVSYPSSQESPKASYSSSPQPAPAPAAAEKPKKKFNWLAILIAVAVFFGARTIGQNPAARPAPPPRPAAPLRPATIPAAG